MLHWKTTRQTLQQWLSTVKASGSQQVAKMGPSRFGTCERRASNETIITAHPSMMSSSIQTKASLFRVTKTGASRFGTWVKIAAPTNSYPPKTCRSGVSVLQGMGVRWLRVTTRETSTCGKSVRATTWWIYNPSPCSMRTPSTSPDACYHQIQSCWPRVQRIRQSRFGRPRISATSSSVSCRDIRDGYGMRRLVQIRRTW